MRRAAQSFPEGKPVVTRAVAAEAAMWVTRLHGPARSRQMELDCLAWQAKSAANRLAFERCTDTWQAVGGITVADVFAAAPAAGDPRPARVRRWLAAGGLVVVGIAAAVLVPYWRALGLYESGVGEQRAVLIEDGTRLTLNTATRVRVALDRHRRVVDVERGEALFDVAKDAGRPFVVRAAGTEVTAVGTSFVVRRAGAAEVVVTLLEGHVSVKPVLAAGSAASAAVAMEPGQRLRIAAGAAGVVPRTRDPLRLDPPQLEQAVAWRRNLAIFDNTSLAEAVAEMNRYHRTPIVLIGGPALANRRVSGVFRTGDSEGFARAVAEIHRLRLKQTDGGWELAPPS